MDAFQIDNIYKQKLLDRFVKYAKINTQSCGSEADKGVTPSTTCQFDLAKIIVEELKSFGIQDVVLDENCYLYAKLPASVGCESVDSFCLLAHLDTAEDVSGKGVEPIVHQSYPDSKIALNNGVILDGKTDKALQIAMQNGEKIITSNGDTLLGADDKAGVSEIVTAIEYICQNQTIKHGPIEIVFSPDEETGHGMDKVPLQKIKSKFAYTVDGGDEGELEVECFNAALAKIHFIGKATHTGNAKEKGMVNANCVMADFIAKLPIDARPETTSGYEGFFAVIRTNATIEQAQIEVLLRDFSTEGLNNKREQIKQIAKDVALKNRASYDIHIVNQYENMKAKIDEHPEVTEKLLRAYKESNVVPKFNPIRGGTDGSALTKMGLPTPNIFTGGHNFHSRFEWASFEQMCKVVEVLVNLAKI